MVGCPLRPVRRGRGVTTRWNGSVPPLDAAAARQKASPLFLCGHGEDHVASGQVHQVVLIFQSVGHSDGISLEKVLGKAAVTSLSPLP